MLPALLLLDRPEGPPRVSALPAIGVVARSVLRRLHLAPPHEARERERRARAEREAKLRNAPRHR